MCPACVIKNYEVWRVRLRGTPILVPLNFVRLYLTFQILYIVFTYLQNVMCLA